MSNYSVTPRNTPQNLALQIKWEKDYQALLMKFLKQHDTFNGSAVAAWMRKQGLQDPVHHNEWGAQIKYYSNPAFGLFTNIGKAIPTGAAHIQQVGLWKSLLFGTK